MIFDFWVFVMGGPFKREKRKEQSKEDSEESEPMLILNSAFTTGFSLIPPLCSSLTDKPLQLYKGVAKCVIRLSWWTNVSLSLIWDAVCVTNGPEACQLEQIRGRGRDAGHFDIRLMETLLWFSTRRAHSQISSSEKWIKLNPPYTGDGRFTELNRIKTKNLAGVVFLHKNWLMRCEIKISFGRFTQAHFKIILSELHAVLCGICLESSLFHIGPGCQLCIYVCF